MDLVVIPLLLVAGAALTFLGINGLPSAAAVPERSNPSADVDAFPLPERRSDKGVAAGLLMKAWLPRLGQERATVTHTERPASFTDSDVLLSDVLSELLVVRQELADLRSRFEALSGVTEEPAPKKRGRRGAEQTALTPAG
jgi:hypothetical protein